MKKIIFTLLTVAALSHAGGGWFAYMEAEEANNHARAAEKTAQQNKFIITTIYDSLKTLNVKVKLMNDSIHALNVKLDSLTAQNAEILEYVRLNMKKKSK